MKRLKLYEQFVREFVENSKITLDELYKAKNNIELLKNTVLKEFIIDDEESDELIDTFNSLLDIRVFEELNLILNKYFNSTTTMNNLYSSLEQASHLLKDMIEQYNLQNVQYSHKKIDSSIDKFVNDLNYILPFALKKISSEKNAELEPHEMEIMESIKNKKRA